MNMSRPLKGQSVAVIGLGSSGIAAAKLALEKGGNVYVSEVREDKEACASASQLREIGIEVELGPHVQRKIAEAGTIVVSPGISPSAKVLKELADNGLSTISEPEFAFRFFNGPLIAVTGTNGKTTTAMLIAQFLKADGQDIAVGGNIGGGLAPPASELAISGNSPSWYVLELSSFQLSGIVDLKPAIGVFTNLAPDHLDRYDSVDSYYRDKSRIFDNADEKSRWVLNGDDSELESLAQGIPGERFYFSEEYADRAGAYLESGVLTVELTGSKYRIAGLQDVTLVGRHNIQNVLAAALTAKLAGTKKSSISAGLKEFSGLPHRTEKIAENNKITWVNDSKATNVTATINGITSFDSNLLVLLGGQDKGENFCRLVKPLKENDSKVLAYGESGIRLYEQLKDEVRVRLVKGSFEDLIRSAIDWVESGDTVLLSPACPSFDMFKDYEHRGERFRHLVTKFLESSDG
tara:strand:- start:10346 stop:11737 length:1392 start_codon:yes stop_codon:yes gene_type:complete